MVWSCLAVRLIDRVEARRSVESRVREMWMRERNEDVILHFIQGIGHSETKAKSLRAESVVRDIF